MSDSIIERLRHHSKDERNTAFARSTMREAADELTHYKEAATKLSAETYGLEADLAACREREARMRGAAMLLRGRLLLENPNAVTDDADAALAEGAQG